MATGDLQRVFGRNLREYRRAHGVSQEALAQSLQVHRTYMGGIERGERNPTLQSVERIAERLGVAPLALLTEPPASPMSSAILEESAPWA